MKLKQFIFALVAMLSCFGFTANAENVAKVGNTEYATIDEAIAAWTNNTTLTLLSDVTLSDVVTLKSTEHHILNLGTYTMTAAKGMNAFVIKACGTGDSERTAITINADATNPGGIHAGSKCVVYYKYTDGGISTNDRPIIKINGGVFTGSTSSWGTAGIYTIGAAARKCATLDISGGTFNCTINGATKSKLIISGGIFNYSVGSTGDNTAIRKITGGKFKSFGFFTNDNKNNKYDKFTIGSGMEKYDVGVYVDKAGYLCVGGPVITALSPKYRAVASNATKWSSHLMQSSAYTQGLYYEDPAAAIKKHGEANVTVWEKPAVTIPENVEGAATVVEEIKNNTALKGYTPENLPAGAELEIVLESVEGKFVYDVTPMANGAKVETTEEITFRLPVPASVTTAYAKVYHEGTLMGLYEIKGEGNAKYVEISSANFSEFSVEPVAVVAKIGETAYATLSEAFAAVTNDNQTVVICKDVTENLTATLRGNITTENGAKVTITLTNSDWVYCPYTFVLGENVTMNVPALFYYAGGAQINGTLVVDAYYQRYANTKLTINEPGSMTVKSETCIIRYMEDDANAGIYVNGDNDPETVGLNLAVAYFYQGMINAKNANIVAGTYWQTNETDGQGSANLVLDNSTLTVTVYDHPAKATGNSTVTLTNESVLNAQNGGFTYGDNAKISVDATSKIIGKDGEVKFPVASVGGVKYYTLEEAFEAATEGQTITLVDDATPVLQSQRAITKAAVIDLGSKTLTLTEDDLYFGTTTFKNGTIVVDPSVKPSTAVFWMFANQTLTFDNVKIVATGVTGTYLIGLEGENSDLNLLNGSEILVENTTALDLDIICVNGTNTCDIKVEDSKVNVTNLDGRVFFRGNYTVKDSEVNLAGITKAGFRIEAGQTLSIEGTSKVTIKGEPRDGGIHLTDLTATYTKEETANVTATVNEPKVAKIGENTYRTLAQAVAAVEDGGTITLIANETFTKNNRYNNGGWWDGLGYSGDKSFTIDLNDFTVSQDGSLNDYLFWFKNVGSKENTITIKNGTLDAGTTAFCALCTASSHENKLTINTENLTLINNKSDGSTVKVRAGSVLNVKAGTKITGKNSYLGIENWKATVNIYDGAEIYMNGTASYNGCLAGVGGGGTINVYGGYGKGVKGGFIAMTSGGTINISGGEWIANTDGTVGNNSNLYVLTAQSNKSESGFAGPSIINVTGGTFRGGMDAWVLNNLEGEKAELNITGGNFNVNPTSYVADGYVAVENNGVWTVEQAVAKVGDIYYATLAEAFAAVGDGTGKTVELIADVNLADAEWTPVTFNGVFDGKDHTISNLVVNGGRNSNQGFFAQTQNGEIKNVTFNNAKVTGRLNVGVVAGTPYTSKYTNVKVTGHVEVNGMAYVGGVGGKNAYADWTDITVDVDETSYVKATSTENGTAYRTYVGGVIGFNGQGGHTFKNISSNIKVIGDVMDIGGIFGILHYGNKAENITFTGAVEAPTGATQVGGIAGVWHNEKGQTVTITNAKSEGTVKVGDVTTTGSLVGGAYNAENQSPETSGSLIIDGKEAWVGVAMIGDTYYVTLEEALRYAQDGSTVKLLANVNLTSTTTISKAITLDGNNHKLTVSGNGVHALTVSAAKDKTVTFKNLEVACTGYGAGSITAGIYNTGKNNLVLDNVNVLSSNYGIFSSTGNIVVNNSTLKGDMYAIYSSVEADIQLDGSRLEKTKNYGAGSAIYVQKSSSKLDIVNSTITAYAPQANIVAAIEIGDNNVEMNIDENSTITIEGNNVYVVYVGDKMHNSNKITSGNYNIAAGATINKPNAMLPTIFIKDSKVQLVKDNVAPVMCFTLQNAVNDVEEDQTVQLIDNLELSDYVTVPAGVKVFVNLNGFDITYTSDVAGEAMITNNGELGFEGNGEVVYTYIGAADAAYTKGNYTIANRGKLTIDGGIIKNATAAMKHASYAIDNEGNATLVINGGQVINTYNYAIRQFASGNNANSITVNGGEVSGTRAVWMQAAGSSTADAPAIKLNVTGGKLIGTGESADYTLAVYSYNYGNSLKNVAINIKGGEIVGDIALTGGKNKTVAETVEITGGTITNIYSYADDAVAEKTINITGGSFLNEISETYLAWGYQLTGDAAPYVVDYTGRRESVTIVDGQMTEFVNEKDIEVGTLTYKRTLLADNLWSPLYVPFEIPLTEEFLKKYSVAYINDVHSFDNDYDGEIDDTKVELIYIKSGKLKANYPYLIRTNDVAYREWNLELKNTTLYPAEENQIKCSSVFTEYKVTGTYRPMTIAELDGALTVSTKGAWQPSSSGLKAFRLYLTMENLDGSYVVVEPNMTIRMYVRGEEETTGIVGTEFNTNGEELIFDLQGRRVLEPKKGGIYIINGKKVYYNK